MKDIVKLLSDTVANQIAAGEVIQRPASVVKELLENAVDSGAAHIQLIVKDAGRTLIQVIDDGTGMSFNDARLCFERHATSKLQTAADLYNITTKGFRGEALASIAAIAHVELKTKMAEEQTGTRVLIEGAQVKAHEVIVAQDGTSIAVKNLFFNVPARRNFLKSDNVEMTHIEEELYRVALIHHELHFTCYVNGNLQFQWMPSNFKQRIIHVFGNHFKDKLFPVEQTTDFMRISGYIAKPENAKKKKSEQYLFINRRYVRHNLLNYAIETAYSELIPQGYKPAFFIEIEVDPATIDINVSPTKIEVKLQDEKLMFGFLNSTVKKSLGTMSLIPRIDFDVDPAFDLPDKPKDKPLVIPGVHRDPNYNPFKTASSTSTSTSSAGSYGGRINMEGWEDFLKGIKTQDVSHIAAATQLKSDLGEELPENTAITSENIPDTFPFFIAGNRYLFINLNDKVLIVDIANARERILFDRYMEALHNTPIHVQQSLFPVTITLTPAQADMIESLKNDFIKLGYDLEKMDNTHFAVNGTPDNEDEEGDLQATIENVLNSFKTNMFLYKSDKESNMAFSFARQNRSRHKPMKEVAEVRAFLQRLLQCSCPGTTPSRKNIFHYLGDDELQRFFD